MRRRFGYLLRRFRRPIAASLAFVTVLGALSVLRPAPPETMDLLIAARDLPAGTVLEPADVTSRAFALDSTIPGAITDVAQRGHQAILSSVASALAAAATTC